ncbi:class I SAM-dependent DNA methyltransferase [Actinokineospora globicatena]|uniref:Methyltransferase domain-containing protein n=1 Tax=Actinokineospora globicatena TaxID=103729 RepID=A0A9W6QHK3_9PSEU|nr:class I SAM-dependent methyltransferase [Actinokineospora globicatena]GLW89880.1 hypothetical protein Aglo03_06960 [Actinokineospora globicatena]
MTAIPTQSAYSRDHADVFEAVHAARGRDWAAEADTVTRLALQRSPGATSLLDIACGTGAHLTRFRSRFARVAGVELSPAMRGIAEDKLPGVPIHQADMRDFDLGERFDVITCLCFSIAYTRDTDELRQVTTAIARHLTPDGVVVIEPWWFPTQFLDGYVTASTATTNDRAVSRVSHSVRADRSTHMTVRYTIADHRGIRDFTEHEVLSLFTEAEYTAAFEAAGIRVEHQPGPPNDRGLIIGGL